MSALAQLFRRGKNLFGLDAEAATARAAARAVYAKAVAQARQPHIYSEFGVPDTPDGRLEMVQLHVILILRRLQRGSEHDQVVGQQLFNVFFRDVDHSLREAGVGDLSVGKWIRKLAEQFYARVAEIETGLETENASQLQGALDRNVLAAQGWDPSALVAYLQATDKELGRQAADVPAAGGDLVDRLRFEPIPANPARHP